MQEQQTTSSKVFPNNVDLGEIYKYYDVDEKYFLKEKTIEWYESNSQKQKEEGNGFKFEPTEGNCVAKAITTKAGGRMDDKVIIHSAEKSCFNNADVMETLEKNKSLEHGDYIDAYNHNVVKGICGTVHTGMSCKNESFVVVEELGGGIPPCP